MSKKATKSFAFFSGMLVSIACFSFSFLSGTDAKALDYCPLGVGAQPIGYKCVSNTCQAYGCSWEGYTFNASCTINSAGFCRMGPECKMGHCA